MSSRVLSQPEDVRPLYPVTRLVKGAVLEAERLLTEAREARARAADEIAGRRAASERELQVDRENATREIAALRDEARRDAADEAMRDASRLIDEIAARHRELQRVAASRLVETALALARAVLRAELHTRPELLLELVEETLASGRRERDLRLCLSRDDVTRLGSRLDALLARTDSLRIIADDALPPFSVRLETASGIHDGSLETRLAALETHVRSRIAREPDV